MAWQIATFLSLKCLSGLLLASLKGALIESKQSGAPPMARKRTTLPVRSSRGSVVKGGVALLMTPPGNLFNMPTMHLRKRGSWSRDTQIAKSPHTVALRGVRIQHSEERSSKRQDRYKREGHKHERARTPNSCPCGRLRPMHESCCSRLAKIGQAEQTQ